MKKHGTRAQKSMLRKWVVSIFALLALTGAAYAQAGTDQMLKDKDASDASAAKEFIGRMQTDQQYEKAIREQPSAATSSDPWGTVRTNAAPGNAAAKPASKSATGAAKTASRTASGASKPAAAAGKPATNAAASPNNNAPKAQ
jgi:hypothetical protein